MKNALLLLIALALGLVLIPSGILYTVYKAIRRRSWRKILGYLDSSAGVLALAIDHLGNVVCRDLFDDIFRTRQGYAFGNIKETISAVLGRNHLRDTLTAAGELLVAVLDAIDENHVIKAIKD